MAKCASCRKQFDAPFWKFATLCPECKSAHADLQVKLKGLTPVFIVTPCLVGLNVLVFCLMVATGASVMDPGMSDLIRWGASYGPLSLGPEPWRIVTAMFVHIGIIHLAFNMWCLWSLGALAERLMGNWNFLILYLLSGVGGSLVSLWLHPRLVSAGASGAIFGLAGGLIALLGMKKAQISSAAMQQALKSVVIFVIYNLAYGMKGGIDNAAHLGGLLSGAALGAFLPRRSSLADSAAGLSAPPLADSEAAMFSPFQFAGVGLCVVLFLGFKSVRNAHQAAGNSGETMQVELLRLKDADRASLQDAAKQVEGGNPDDAAIDKLKTVSAHAPSSSLAHVILAEAYSQRKQYDQAIGEFRKAIAIQPGYAPAHAELGLDLIRNRDYDQAIQEERAALRLEPKNGDAHNNLGVALERKGDVKGALAEYGAACEIDPKDEIFAGNLKRLEQQTAK